MKRIKTFAALLLALCMMFSLGVTAFADGETTSIDEPGNATTKVNLEVTAPTFNVTVPTTILFSVAADGTVTTPSNVKVHNGCNGPIQVSGVAVESVGDWTVVDYAADMKGVTVNTKNFGLMINGEQAVSEVSQIAGTIVSEGKSNGVIAANSDSNAITFAANIPVQSATITSTEVARIVFTVRWYDTTVATP